MGWGRNRAPEESSGDAELLARVPLGRLLIDAGLTKAQVDDALAEGRDRGERLGEVLVRRGLLSEDDLARLLAQQWELEYVERSAIWFDANALAKLSRADAQRLEALPTRVEGGRVVVALAEPTEQRLASLREFLGDETVFIVVPKSALDAGLRSDLLRATSTVAPTPPAEGELEPPRPVPALSFSSEQETPGSEPELAPPSGQPPHLAPVIPLPLESETRLDPDRGADSASSLVDEAQALAERLSAQAAAVRAQQHVLRGRSAQYEHRIAELEEALQDRDGRLHHLRVQLTHLVESLGVHAHYD